MLMTKFADLALDPRVLQAVAETGYETPTPIQEQAIPPALEGRDVLGIAQTGTGKTASFSLPMITILGQGRARARMPRSLVLCPTRELAAQVAENFDTYAKHTKLTKALLIGGVSFGDQDKAIDRGVDVLIATPGRLLDHFERGKLMLNGVQIMVIDEADRMLDMGFIPDIERIFTLTPPTRQTLFFSATMAPEIERITKAFLKDPVKIEVARQATANTSIEQKLFQFTPSRKDRSFTEKRAALRALITGEGEALTNAIVFCNRKMDVDVVAKSLKAHGFDAAPIHGDLDQSQRTRTLEGFRDGTLRLLIASDVAARGLDIPAVSHVFNFDVPTHPEDYVHRIGRTGRAGRLGKAFTLAVPADDKYIGQIESLLKMAIPRADLPEGALEGASENSDRARTSSSRGGSSRGRGESGRSEGGRSRSRSGSGAPRDPIPVIEAEAAPAEAVEAVREAPRAEPVREPRREAERSTGERSSGGAGYRDRNGARGGSDRGPERSGERSSERYGERRDEGRPVNRSYPGQHERIVGMGDHVPDFILRSFKIAAPVVDEAAEDSDAA
ncbi:DEAD/DEAH box helicase [Rhodobacteraceae bacterium CYK-10]|uniref:DEAD-box ATP-dependent RNA helicase RhpA n=2 Tax=Stagnihabitans tardus TaxID=2699202 RepID=A0AAE4Y7T5_9RHOB|nr:DEAD/DEAH box helicase [Stagnihabitans tardus]